MLIGRLFFFKEDQLCVFSCSLGRSCDIPKHSSGNADVVPYFVSHASYRGLLAPFSRLFATGLLQEVKLVYQIYDLCQHLCGRSFGFVKFAECDAGIDCVRRAHDDLDALVDNVHQKRHFVGILFGIFH
jgi:hypothetical protein